MSCGTVRRGLLVLYLLLAIKVDGVRLAIGSGKVLVRVDNVLDPKFKPRFLPIQTMIGRKDLR